MFKCGLYYQTNTLHIAYSNQQFEPTKYTCDVKNIHCNLRFKILNHL
jgi:hypothetical protein